MKIDNWNKLVNLIMSSKYSTVTKMIWEDFVVITDHGGTRFKITADCEYDQVEELLNIIIYKKYGYTFVRNRITNIVMLSSFTFIFILN